MATTDISDATLTEYRVAMIEELGFSNEEATRLVESFYDKTLDHGKNGKKTYHIRVDHHYVRKMLAGGATKEQVMYILTDDPVEGVTEGR